MNILAIAWRKLYQSSECKLIEKEREKNTSEEKIERQREWHDAHCEKSSIEINRTKRRESPSPVEYKNTNIRTIRPWVNCLLLSLNKWEGERVKVTQTKKRFLLLTFKNQFILQSKINLIRNFTFWSNTFSIFDKCKQLICWFTRKEKW